MSGEIILVIGATGHQGGAVVQALKERTEFGVRALVRGQGAGPRATALREQGVEVAEGDLDDNVSLLAAMQGVYGVFCALNFRNGGVDKEAERGQRIADLAKQAGVRHFVYSSVGGAERHSGVPHFESKWRVEEHIRAIGLPYSVVRPVAFMTNLMEGSGVMRWLALSMFRGMTAHRPAQMVAVADIGKWVALMFSEPKRYVGQAVEIAGDELTYDQMVQAYMKVYGQRLHGVSLPPKLFGSGDAGKMINWIADHGYAADISAVRRAVPDMLSFEEFIAQRRAL